jgi:YVTN family beta-propeller protein
MAGNPPSRNNKDKLTNHQFRCNNIISKKMKNRVLLTGMLIISTVCLCQCQQSDSEYRIVNRFQVEGDGGWDYLAFDDSTGRLFISHGTITQVIDSKTGKLIETINNTEGVHGIALDRKDNKAFISCGRDSSVLVVDLNTLQFISRIKVTGASPDAILYDEFSGHVFVYNGRSANATVIDPKNNTVSATIPLTGKPEFSVSDGNGKVYVNIEDKSQICVIDAQKLQVEALWSVAPGEEPSGLAIDKESQRLFSVCGNKKMIVLNAKNGKIISILDIGAWVDGCVFDPGLKRAYSSNGEGTVTVVQEVDDHHFIVFTTIQTMRGARTIALDHNTHHLYLSTAEYGPAPESTAEHPHPRPSIVPGTFVILDLEPR